MQQTGPSVIVRLLRATALIEDTLLVVLLTAMVSLSAAQIVLRNLFDGAILWADPVLRVSVLWVGMIGAMVATRADKQISIDALSRFLPQRWRIRARVITDLFTSGVSAVVAWNAVRLVVEDRASGVNVIASVPVWACEVILPVAFGVIALRFLLFAIRHGRQSLRGEAES